MDHNLHVVFIGHGDGSSRWRPASCPNPRAVSAKSRRRVTISTSSRQRRVALPAKARFIGNASPLRSCGHVPGSGRAGRASVPCAGPSRPPSMHVRPLISASSICCGADEVYMGYPMPPAVTILPSAGDNLRAGTEIMVTPAACPDCRLAIARDPPVLQPDIRFTIPHDRGSAHCDHRVDRAAFARSPALRPCVRG